MMSERVDVTKLQKTMGATVKSRRRLLGLTQEQLAEHSGLSANYIAKLEQGWKSPSLQTLVVLARALGVSAADLLEETKKEERLEEAHNLASLISSLSQEDAELTLKLLTTLAQHLRTRREPESPG
jgi:transcriptional regulator with XRE-family HTH domain